MHVCPFSFTSPFNIILVFLKNWSIVKLHCILISCVQQCEIYIYIYTHTHTHIYFFRLFYIVGYCKTVSVIPCANPVDTCCLSTLYIVVCICGEGNGTPLQYSCLENPMDRGAWWAAVHGVARSRTRRSDFTFTFHFHALERKWQLTPVFLPGESQGWGSLVGCCLWGRTESGTTEVT